VKEHFILLLSLALCSVLVASTNESELPIFQFDANGRQNRVESKNLFTLEKMLRKQIVGTDAPDEIFAFAASGSFDFLLDLADEPVTFEELMVITVRGRAAELRWSSDRGKTCMRRKLTEDEIKRIRAFVADERVDQLPLLGATRTIDGKEENVVGGTVCVYLHLSQKVGRRVLINNPPTRDDDKIASEDPVWKYTKIVEFFNALKQTEVPASP
jgi:hypothetical protein